MCVATYREMVDRTPPDPWAGMSEDVVERFMDTLRVTRRNTTRTRARYRAVLLDLDRWMQQYKSRTLVTARGDELVEYLADRAVRSSARVLASTLSSLRRFYRHLQQGRCRDDDPMRGQMVRSWCDALRASSSVFMCGRRVRAASAERDRIMLALMIVTGMQSGELAKLKLRDLKLQQGCLTVRHAGELHDVPLSGSLASLLRHFVDGPRPILAKAGDAVRLFPACGDGGDGGVRHGHYSSRRATAR